MTELVWKAGSQSSLSPQLSSTYGPIFTVWLGLKPVVVLCGYEAVKDALVGHSEEFGGRPQIPLLMQLNKDYGECLDLSWMSRGEQMAVPKSREGHSTQDLQHPFPALQDP